VTTWT